MPAASRSRSYRFGAAVLDPPRRTLVIDGAPVAITARAFDLLVLLVERAGSLVRKDEIFDRVWPGVVVEENNLQVQISMLRKALGSGVIETVPGSGYRFAPGVEVSEGDDRPATCSNLPIPLTRFVGDRARIDQCARLLGDSRLMTLTGAGGLGKTRLSIETANACLGRYAGGVWFVDLASIMDPLLVPQAVALALGVAEQAGERVVGTSQRFIKDRRVLLILDNCEHLLRSCADFVVSLLRGCAKLTILTTSREPLHVQGESVYPMSALSVPSLATPSRADAALRFDAVRLFVERATAVRPDFRLTDGNARAVCEICARVDGIPLAIELAAARVRTLPAQDIAERLGDRFRLLTNRDSTAPSRQQTLRSTIDWSYDLLDESEKVLLQRLAVFGGGWTLPAAEAVCAGGDLAADAVVDAHGHLVDKSLVTADTESRRYAMLDTIHQYALERLEASGEADAVRTAHLAFHADLAEHAESRLIGPDEDAWIARLDAERQNLRAAYAWSRTIASGASYALRLAYGARRWLCRGGLDLGRPVLADELAHPDVQPSVRCRGLVAGGYLSYFAGRYDDARRLAEEAFTLAEGLDDKARAADAKGLVGLSLLDGDLAAAAQAMAEAVALARLAGDGVVVADQLIALGEAAAAARSYEAAERHYEEALAAARALRSRVFTLANLFNLGRLCLGRDDRMRASALLREAVTLADEGGSTRHAPVFLTFAAALAGRVEPLRAARFHGAAKREYDDAMLQPEPADRLVFDPCIAQARAAADPAEFAQAEAAGSALRREDTLAELREWLTGQS